MLPQPHGPGSGAVALRSGMARARRADRARAGRRCGSTSSRLQWPFRGGNGLLEHRVRSGRRVPFCWLEARCDVVQPPDQATRTVLGETDGSLVGTHLRTLEDAGYDSAIEKTYRGRRPVTWYHLSADGRTGQVEGARSANLMRLIDRAGEALRESDLERESRGQEPSSCNFAARGRRRVRSRGPTASSVRSGGCTTGRFGTVHAWATRGTVGCAPRERSVTRRGAPPGGRSGRIAVVRRALFELSRHLPVPKRGGTVGRIRGPRRGPSTARAWCCIRTCARRRARRPRGAGGASSSPRKHAKRMATVVYAVAPFVRSRGFPAEPDAGGQGQGQNEESGRDRGRPRPVAKRVWASLEHEPAEVVAEAMLEAERHARSASSAGSCSSTAPRRNSPSSKRAPPPTAST